MIIVPLWTFKDISTLLLPLTILLELIARLFYVFEVRLMDKRKVCTRKLLEDEYENGVGSLKEYYEIVLLGLLKIIEVTPK